MTSLTVYLIGATIAFFVASFIYSCQLRMAIAEGADKGIELEASDILFGAFLSALAGFAWPLIFVIGIIGGIPWWIAGRVVERRIRRDPKKIQERIRELERDLNMTPNSLFDHLPKEK